MFILYTSGSDRPAEGACCTHGGLHVYVADGRPKLSSTTYGRAKSICVHRHVGG